MDGCVFCAKAKDERWSRTVVRFEPLNPVTAGHMLFVPREHVADAAENHVLTGLTFQEAARYAEGRGEAFNLITSAGSAATQTVRHLHVHYVPRRFDDGLALPWSLAAVGVPADQERNE